MWPFFFLHGDSQDIVGRIGFFRSPHKRSSVFPVAGQFLCFYCDYSAWKMHMRSVEVQCWPCKLWFSLVFISKYKMVECSGEASKFTMSFDLIMICLAFKYRQPLKYLDEIFFHKNEFFTKNKIKFCINCCFINAVS